MESVIDMYDVPDRGSLEAVSVDLPLWLKALLNAQVG